MLKYPFFGKKIKRLTRDFNMSMFVNFCSLVFLFKAQHILIFYFRNALSVLRNLSVHCLLLFFESQSLGSNRLEL